MLGLVVLVSSCAGEGTKPKTGDDDDDGSGGVSSGGGPVYRQPTGGVGGGSPYATGGLGGSTGTGGFGAPFSTGGFGATGAFGSGGSECVRRGPCNPAFETSCVTSDGATCECIPEQSLWRNCD